MCRCWAFTDLVTYVLLTFCKAATIVTNEAPTACCAVAICRTVAVSV